MKKKIAYLHIGLHKTGSKWIQKIFSLNAPELHKHGIVYPLPEGEVGASHTFHTFNTNAQQLFSAATPIQSIIGKEVTDQPHSLLLSAEAMSKHLAKRRLETPETFEQELHYLKHLGFEEVHFLLLFRDPVERVVSQVNHKIKVSQLETIPDFEYYKTLALEGCFQLVLDLIEFLQSYPACKVTLLNYEAVKEDMITPLTKWLDLPAGTLKTPELSRINRSLSYEEIFALIKIKGAARSVVPAIGFQWMTKLPHVKAEKLYPSVSVQEMIWEMNAPYLDKINSFLPQQQQLNKKIYPAFTPPEKLTFLPEQLDILIQSLAHYQPVATQIETGAAAQKTVLQRLKRFLRG